MSRRCLPFLASGLALALATMPGVRAQPPGPPRVSPMATVLQVVGVSEIAVTYSRPGVKGRIIWGELVPWDEVWRTGANEATTIRFSDPVEVEGHPLEAGVYSLFTIPSRNRWTVIFNREADQWGAFQYDPEQDALRISVEPRPAPFQERLEISVPEVEDDRARVVLHWEKLAVGFQVAVDVEAASLRRARAFVEGAGPGDGEGVLRWATYCYQNDLALEEALGWARDLARRAPMYWSYALESRLLARTGRVQEALERGREALERAAAERDEPGVETDARALAAELGSWRDAGD